MTPALEVLRPGTSTTIQDLGRPSYRSAGVPLGGAMDRFALAAANLLVGNPRGAPGLEWVWEGPAVRALEEVHVAVTGGQFDLRVNGEPAPDWTTVRLGPGDVLTTDRRQSGARGYLAVAGGFSGERWLGSMSTYLLAGRGGLGGRQLQAGDRLDHGPGTQVREASLPSGSRPAYSGSPELWVISGPHDRRLEGTSRRAVFGATFEVRPEADRMGYRLAGPALAVKGGELLSFGLAPGCIQITGEGPVLLMADHHTAGGYPLAGCVVRAHLPLAAQLLPGDSVRFREVSLETALAEWQRQEVNLARLQT